MNQSSCRLRPATTADAEAYVGAAIPPEWCVEGWVCGDVIEQDGAIIAYGFVTQDAHGRIWGWFSRRGEVSRFLMHRKAHAMIETLRQAGETAVYVICHPTLPGAALWLRRLGFIATGTVMGAGEVWRCDIKPADRI